MEDFIELSAANFSRFLPSKYKGSLNQQLVGTLNSIFHQKAATFGMLVRTKALKCSLEIVEIRNHSEMMTPFMRSFGVISALLHVCLRRLLVSVLF